MKLLLISTICWFALAPFSHSIAAPQIALTHQDKVKPEDITLSKLEHNQTMKQAQEWGLTIQEWQRYQQLMQGRRGVLSPGLDPITTLGIEARSEQERRHYAELSVKHDFQRVEAELAFQREVNTAWLRIYPTHLPIQTAVDHDSERLALFVRADCGVPCENKITTLLASQQLLDIYLVGSDGKDEVVRTWAKKVAIPIERIKAKTLTLNHDQGQWSQFGQGRMPVVLQQRENGWQITAY